MSNAPGAALYIGLMSGTSLDGVDAALVRFENDSPELLAASLTPMPDTLRETLTLLVEDRASHPLQTLACTEHELALLYADAVLGLLKQVNTEPAAVTAIGCHGQTVRHQPPVSLQLGDASLLAARTGIDTVADFRRADLAAGGQGAPLAPAFHQAMLGGVDGRAVLNIGGIANLTILADDNARVHGFDTGPGNGLMDSWHRQCRGEPFDRDGAWAATGQVNETLLAKLMANAFIQAPPPKSTGRDEFTSTWLARQLETLDPRPADHDIQTTLCEFTARSITEAIQAQAPDTREILVCGGGVHNRELMRRLQARLPGTTIASTASAGIDPDYMEAMAFAWLARQRILGQPGNLPSVTGASKAVILGGVWAAPRDYVIT